MFLHLGDDISICLKDIVAILNFNSVNDAFLYYDHLINISSTKVSSKIVVNRNNVTGIYLSPISSDTLKKRAVIKF